MHFQNDNNTIFFPDLIKFSSFLRFPFPTESSIEVNSFVFTNKSHWKALEAWSKEVKTVKLIYTRTGFEHGKFVVLSPWETKKKKKKKTLLSM